MKASPRSIAPAILTSAWLRDARRGAAALRRTLTGARPTVHYFHQVDDPYSDLAVRALPHLVARYDVAVVPHLVPPPDASAAPEADMLAAWSSRDAAELARGLGLGRPPWDTTPTPEMVKAGQAALAGIADPAAFADTAAQVGEAFRQSDQALMPPATGEAGAALSRDGALRQKLGHYLGGTFYFESEWYWGLDRLPYLEERLAAHARADGPAAPFAPRREVTLTPGALNGRPVLDMFLSFRSPYTYIAMPRAVALAKAYNADLRLRFVLPMVMRGLKVPPAKRFYIVRDTRREADRLGLPFGRIADPVGRPAERGLAVLHHAIAAGRGEDFALSFLKGVFAEGIDAGTDKGLLALCQRAGVGETEMRTALADEGWRAVAEANRAEMFSLGLWGVPSFRVDDGPAIWGQDRLWLVEEQLRAAAA